MAEYVSVRDSLQAIAMQNLRWYRNWSEVEDDPRFGHTLRDLHRKHHYDDVLTWLRVKCPGVVSEISNAVEGPLERFSRIELHALKLIQFERNERKVQWVPDALSRAIEEATKLSPGWLPPGGEREVKEEIIPAFEDLRSDLYDSAERIRRVVVALVQANIVKSNADCPQDKELPKQPHRRRVVVDVKKCSVRLDGTEFSNQPLGYVKLLDGVLKAADRGERFNATANNLRPQRILKCKGLAKELAQLIVSDQHLGTRLNLPSEEKGDKAT